MCSKRFYYFEHNCILVYYLFCVNLCILCSWLFFFYSFISFVFFFLYISRRYQESFIIAKPFKQVCLPFTAIKRYKAFALSLSRYLARLSTNCRDTCNVLMLIFIMIITHTHTHTDRRSCRCICVEFRDRCLFVVDFLLPLFFAWRDWRSLSSFFLAAAAAAATAFGNPFSFCH